MPFFFSNILLLWLFCVVVLSCINLLTRIERPYLIWGGGGGGGGGGSQKHLSRAVFYLI